MSESLEEWTELEMSGASTLTLLAALEDEAEQTPEADEEPEEPVMFSH